MSLTVKHLNGDTTFLLTFAPTENPPHIPTGPRDHHPPGTFTILIDPWLSGPSTMWHPKFLLSNHTVESCISHLSDIPEPNVVIVSQDKPDHCHEATLRQLDPTSPITTVLAEPNAHKRIRSMKHFNPFMVHSLRPFSLKDPNSIIRFLVPPIVPGGAAGEVAISFIPAKMDMAGVHNAIGVTYRPPSTIVIPSRPFSPPSSSSYGQFNFNTHDDPATNNLPATPPESPLPGEAVLSLAAQQHSTNTSTSASNPSDTFTSDYNFSTSSISSVSTRPYAYSRPNEKTLSFIYSPHGVDYSLIRPWASSHLLATAALPLTLLLHSFDRVNNPWWMGGNVAAGLPGGVEIAQNLMARCWVSAHDEDKDNSGLSVKNVKTRKYTTEEVEGLCRQGKAGGLTSVLNLAAGEEIILRR